MGCTISLISSWIGRSDDALISYIYREHCKPLATAIPVILVTAVVIAFMIAFAFVLRVSLLETFGLAANARFSSSFA